MIKGVTDEDLTKALIKAFKDQQKEVYICHEADFIPAGSGDANLITVDGSVKLDKFLASLYETLTILLKKTPADWLKEPQYKGLIIMDPDGWDRRNYAVDWAIPLTESEFAKKAMNSTCKWPQGVVDVLYRAANS